MKDYMKSYQMVLKTAAPLFIGDGKSLNKKEYFYLRNEKKVLVPDSGKLYEGVWRKRLSRQFTDYLLDKNAREGLEQWMRNNGFRTADYAKWIRYELDGGDHLGEGKRPYEIATFIKDGYGVPYVPGTSIKGMIRNVLLSYELIKHPDICKRIRENLVRNNFEGDRNRKKYMRREAEDIENMILHTLHRKDKHGKEIPIKNGVNDILSGLIVGDSGTIEWKDMMLCQKMDRSPNGLFNNNLNVLREAVKPGVSISFQLTIDTTICMYTIEDIMEAVKLFGERYYEFHLQYFSE
ncbi:MAG: type III-A CRISPR-associated RAMP protein Csm5, partial [Lachnospiraceae bacterium]|nr:type III-A CRISPR-associated RAMP protein Csm5 [Lachnospiraceae bacterium]